MRGVSRESENGAEETHAAVAVAGRRAVRVRRVLRRQVVEVVRDAHVVARLDGRVDEVSEALSHGRLSRLEWLRAHLESAASRPVPVVLDLRRLPVALFHERDAELLREARTDAVPRHLGTDIVHPSQLALVYEPILPAIRHKSTAERYIYLVRTTS